MTSTTTIPSLLRQGATAVAAGRVALGVTALAWPSVPARPWVGAAADGVAARVFGRALGARDLALGLGALAALQGPGAEAGSARAWVAAAPCPMLSTWWPAYRRGASCRGSPAGWSPPRPAAPPWPGPPGGVAATGRGRGQGGDRHAAGGCDRLRPAHRRGRDRRGRAVRPGRLRRRGPPHGVRPGLPDRRRRLRGPPARGRGDGQGRRRLGWALGHRTRASAGGDVPAALASWERQQLALGRALLARCRDIGDSSQVHGTFRPGDQRLIFGLYGPGNE